MQKRPRSTVSAGSSGGRFILRVVQNAEHGETRSLTSPPLTFPGPGSGSSVFHAAQRFVRHEHVTARPHHLVLKTTTHRRLHNSVMELSPAAHCGNPISYQCVCNVSHAASSPAARSPKLPKIDVASASASAECGHPSPFSVTCQHGNHFFFCVCE